MVYPTIEKFYLNLEDFSNLHFSIDKNGERLFRKINKEKIFLTDELKIPISIKLKALLEGFQDSQNIYNEKNKIENLEEMEKFYLALRNEFEYEFYSIINTYCQNNCIVIQK